MVTIRNQLVASRAQTWPGTNRATSITIHETANTSRGADAQAHANLQSNGNVRQASWHIQVDDRQAIRSFPDTVRCWHAGRAAEDSIAIEVCVNSDGDYEKALANAADVVRQLRAAHGLGRSALRTHHDWTGKHCPTRLRNSGRWSQFVASTDPQTVKEAVVPRFPNDWKWARDNNIYTKDTKPGANVDTDTLSAFLHRYHRRVVAVAVSSGAGGASAAVVISEIVARLGG